MPAKSKAKTTTPDFELDVSGLNCPLPILRAKKSLSEMKSGQILRVLATDPDSMRDFQAYSKESGHELLSANEDEGLFEYVMRRK